MASSLLAPRRRSRTTAAKKRSAKRSASKSWRWQEGSRIAAGYAAALGHIVDQIKGKDGRFEAQNIVNAARPKSSPIHGLFEWDDSVAAERYRCEQARGYVRALVVVVSNGKQKTMPVAVSLGAGDGYTDTNAVMHDIDLRKLFLANAVREAKSWADRYRRFEELARVVHEIDTLG